jgi:hypothetical protein
MLGRKAIRAKVSVHHVPYLFVYAGKPWLTQKWVRRILSNAYHNSVNGICGNDDVGQMSAWYVLSAMGFYPVCPGNGIYILGGPLFSQVTLHLDEKWYKGAKLTIAANNNAAGHPLSRVQSLMGYLCHAPGFGTTKLLQVAPWNSKWAPSPTENGQCRKKICHPQEVSDQLALCLAKIPSAHDEEISAKCP